MFNTGDIIEYYDKTLFIVLETNYDVETQFLHLKLLDIKFLEIKKEKIWYGKYDAQLYLSGGYKKVC